MTARLRCSRAQLSRLGCQARTGTDSEYFYHQITCTFPDWLKCLILSSRGQTNGWPWILQSCSSQVDTGYRDWPINQTLDALEASFRRPAQPRHADTHKLIRFQLRWSPGPASDGERDASFKKSNCHQALTGIILVQAQGPSKYFIKFHEIHFLIH